MGVKIKVFLVSLVLSILGRVEAATMEVFPADLRQNATIDCIGGQSNAILFVLLSDRASGGTPCKYPVKDFKSGFDGATVSFSVDIPKDLEYLGTVEFRDASFNKNTKSKTVTINGKEYNRYTTELNAKTIVSRVVKGKHRYEIMVWVKVPKKYQGEIKWRLLKNNKEVVSAGNPIHSVGVLPKDIKRPKNFIFYLTYPEYLPNELVSERMELYKKMGVTHFSQLYKEDGFSPERLKNADALKKNGIIVVGQRGAGFSSAVRKVRRALKSGQGLATASKQAYESILSKESAQEMALIKKYIDGVIYDYEIHGLRKHPGYDDKDCIKAFKKSKGISKDLTSKDLKTKYKKEYADFRENLTTAPLRAVAKLYRQMKKGSVFIEQGSGLPVGSKLDYLKYDKYADYHCPMIYTNPLDFYQRVELTSESINKEKLVPTTCAGFLDSNAKVLSRKEAGMLFLDTMGTASLGCAGIKHWPGNKYFDGSQMLDFVKAARLLSDAEVFYQKGKIDKSINIKGLAYIEKIIELPGRKMDMSTPRWSNFLKTSAKSYKSETLITVLNYHSDEEAFVTISKANAKGSYYLKNINTGKSLTVDNKKEISGADLAKGVIIKVPSRDAGLWILSSSPINGTSGEISSTDLKSDFKKRKAQYNKKAPKIQLGTKGDISIGYENVTTPAGSEPCLAIQTPTQKVFIRPAGATIWKWDVDGKNLILNDGSNADGVGMDLFWLPQTARRTGDEKREMTLTACENNGKQVTLTYEIGLKSSIANVKLIKQYTMQANKSAIGVTISLQNNTEQGQELSYWSHNLFGDATNPKSRVLVVNSDKGLTLVPYGTVKSPSYSCANLDPNYQNKLIRSAKNKTASNRFGEYLGDKKIGIGFVVPEKFMQIYRWEGKNIGSLEWMSHPITIASGNTHKIKYSMHAIKSPDAKGFAKKLFKASSIKEMPSTTKSGASAKTFKKIVSLDDNNNDGIPDSFQLFKKQIDSKISVKKDADGTSVLTFSSSNKGVGGINCKKNKIKLPAGKNYMLSFQFKATNMETGAKWPKGFVAYLFGVRKKYTFIGATGNGSTNGWTTAIVVFNTNASSKDANVYLRFLSNKINGELSIKNISFIEVDEKAPDKGKRYFITEKGKTITGGILKL